MNIKRWVNRRVLCVGLVAVAALTTLASVGTSATRPSAAPIRSAASTGSQAKLATQLALARAATAKYASNLPRAKADGYGIITQMIPNMGYHFMNPKVTGFNVQKPPILVYQHEGSSWHLGALEWVYTAKPAKPPFPGATYGTFGAGCHYVDGTFIPGNTQDACPKENSGAAFNFWHPQLVTLHVWLWYPNPSGLFSGTNPLAAAYNNG